MSKHTVYNSMRKKKRCANCGAVLELTEDRHYIATDQDRTNPLFPKTILIDAYDCQICGRQYMAGIRVAVAEDITEVQK